MRLTEVSRTGSNFENFFQVQQKDFFGPDRDYVSYRRARKNVSRRTTNDHQINDCHSDDRAMYNISYLTYMWLASV